MKNTLRITFGLLAAIAMIGCQKNADKLGTTVRGRSAPSITQATANSTGSPVTNVTVTSSQLSALGNLISTEVPLNTVGQLTGMNVGIHMCNSIPNSASSSAQTPLTVQAGSEIEVTVVDSYVAQGANPIVTKLPLITGYIQASSGYTYIAAEFGDGTGNVAFSGYLDSAGDLIQGQLFNDTFSVGAGLQSIGSFSMTGMSWITGCN